MQISPPLSASIVARVTVLFFSSCYDTYRVELNKKRSCYYVLNRVSKKFLASLSVASLALAIGAVAYAGTGTIKITAYQNPEIQIKVDGSLVDLNSEDGMQYPIVYNGRSYVPARTLAEALGGKVSWNEAESTVEVTSGTVPEGADKPRKDNSDGINGDAYNGDADYGDGVQTNPGKDNGSNNGGGVQTKPGKETQGDNNSGGYKVKYPGSTSSEKVFEDYKYAAREVMMAYADALKSYDMTNLDTWLRNHIQNGTTSSNSAMANLSLAEEVINGVHKQYPAEIINGFADALSNAAKRMDFAASSNVEAYEQYYMLQYNVDLEFDSYTASASVYFDMDLVNGSWVLTEAKMY